MLSRGVRIFSVAGVVMVVLAVATHVLLRYYNAPADAEFNMLDQFVATFASTILAFFIGVLLFDYQVEHTQTKRDRQLKTLLAAELEGILEGLDPANAIKVYPQEDSKTEVVITHVQPTVVEEAIRNGFFDPSRAGKALRLAGNMRAYNTKVSYLMSILSSGTSGETASRRLVLHAAEEIEGTRRAIVADAGLLLSEVVAKEQR